MENQEYLSWLIYSEAIWENLWKYEWILAVWLHNVLHNRLCWYKNNRNLYDVWWRPEELMLIKSDFLVTFFDLLDKKCQSTKQDSGLGLRLLFQMKTQPIRKLIWSGKHHICCVTNNHEVKTMFQLFPDILQPGKNFVAAVTLLFLIESQCLCVDPCLQVITSQWVSWSITVLTKWSALWQQHPQGSLMMWCFWSSLCWLFANRWDTELLFSEVNSAWRWSNWIF